MPDEAGKSGGAHAPAAAATSAQWPAARQRSVMIPADMPRVATLNGANASILPYSEKAIRGSGP
jgi:hypothetical protein